MPVEVDELQPAVDPGEKVWHLAVPLVLGVVMVTILGDPLYSSTRVCNQMALHTVSPAVNVQ